MNESTNTLYMNIRVNDDTLMLSHGTFSTEQAAEKYIRKYHVEDCVPVPVTYTIPRKKVTKTAWSFQSLKWKEVCHKQWDTEEEVLHYLDTEIAYPDNYTPVKLEWQEWE